MSDAPVSTRLPVPILGRVVDPQYRLTIINLVQSASAIHRADPSYDGGDDGDSLTRGMFFLLKQGFSSVETVMLVLGEPGAAELLARGPKQFDLSADERECEAWFGVAERAAKNGQGQPDDFVASRAERAER